MLNPEYGLEADHLPQSALYLPLNSHAHWPNCNAEQQTSRP